MTDPQPTRADHDGFCRVEGWDQVRNARGGTGTHHVTYELALPDGRLLRTRISHPPDRTGYGPGMWKHILRDQLEVSEPEIWACVRKDVLPDRGLPPQDADALPAELVHLLISRVGMAEADVRALGKEQAIERLNQYWTHGR